MELLRSNTAVIVSVGPFYDKTDGVTIETGLTITNERITLVAETDAGSAPTLILDNITGATAATANDLNYITNGDNGMMQLELAAADVNRVGRMKLSITDAANHVPVFHTYFVLPAAIFDWLTGVIVPLPANVTTWLGTAAATPTVAGVPEVDLTHVAGATTDVSALATNVAAILVDTGTTLQAEVDAIQAKTDNLPSDPADASVVAGLIAAVEAKVDIVDTVVDAILVDTGTTLDGKIDTIDGIVDAILVDTAEIGAAGAGLTVLATQASVNALPTAAGIADAVLDEDMTAHQAQGSLGQAIGDPVADTNTIFKAVVTDATGATVGVDVVAVKGDTAAILTDTADMQPKLGSPVVDISADIAVIEAQTDDIGAAGAGLTALATQASVTTIDDFLDTEIAAILAAVDTEVAAIKAKTDSLTYTVANVLDANIQRVNDVALIGDGAATPWGP